MKQTFMKFIEDETSESADLYIYGDIVDFTWWEDDVTANGIREKLDNTSAKTINLHINSLGGDTFTALAIYNLLRNKSNQSKIVVYIDAIAASAASIIAMAGDEIKMPENTLMMIHNCWTYAVGNSKDFRKTADDMDKIMDAVVKCYLSKVKITEDELKNLLDDETYLTADEALDKGFCDEVIKLKDDKSIQQNALSSLTRIIKSSKNKSIKETELIVSKIENKEKEVEESNVKTSLFNLK